MSTYNFLDHGSGPTRNPGSVLDSVDHEVQRVAPPLLPFTTHRHHAPAAAVLGCFHSSLSAVFMCCMVQECSSHYIQHRQDPMSQEITTLDVQFALWMLECIKLQARGIITIAGVYLQHNFDTTDPMHKDVLLKLRGSGARASCATSNSRWLVADCWHTGGTSWLSCTRLGVTNIVVVVCW
ncbi:hypothetical protein MVEN_00083400 [Mycena venus]|uniref:Uncharacterized protein n=1 Tax=Mycena venus TaxID=2733690 RepID=A0A8H6Z763_9AGAR|nr:hypothetical protein MVEN_00083400 [Mycena venus]